MPGIWIVKDTYLTIFPNIPNGKRGANAEITFLENKEIYK